MGGRKWYRRRRNRCPRGWSKAEVRPRLQTRGLPCQSGCLLHFPPALLLESATLRSLAPVHPPPSPPSLSLSLHFTPAPRPSPPTSHTLPLCVGKERKHVVPELGQCTQPVAWHGLALRWLAWPGQLRGAAVPGAGPNRSGPERTGADLTGSY